MLRKRALIRAAEEFATKKAERDQLDARLAELRETLLTAAGDAPLARAGQRVLILTRVPETPATPSVAITPAMVGQVIPGRPGRAGYVRLEVR